MSKSAKEIAKVLVEKFKELERQGELARMGELVGKSIRKRHKETCGWRNRRLPWIGRE